MGKVSVLVPALQFDCYSEVCPVLFCALPQSKKKKATGKTCQNGKTSGYISVFAASFEILKT